MVLFWNLTFKIIKHMGKVNGVSTFNAVFIGLNEYGEIRIQVFAHFFIYCYTICFTYNIFQPSYTNLNSELYQRFN